MKGAYTKRRLDTKNNSFGTIMDAKSLYDNANDENLYSANYTSVLTNKWFVEAQYSKRDLSFIGTGVARSPTPVNGTPIWDRSRGQARFNSPTFCKVCGSGLEIRNNWNTLVKTNYFLSTDNARLARPRRPASTSTRRRGRTTTTSRAVSTAIQATRTVIQGEDIYPVFASDNTTYVEYLPLVAPSVGNDIKTYSFFANDAWRLNPRITLNLGLRYDRNHSKDQAGTEVVEDSAWSPRAGRDLGHLRRRHVGGQRRLRPLRERHQHGHGRCRIGRRPHRHVQLLLPGAGGEHRWPARRC